MPHLGLMIVLLNPLKREILSRLHRNVDCEKSQGLVEASEARYRSSQCNKLSLTAAAFAVSCRRPMARCVFVAGVGLYQP
jgi:hypothetical protein